MLGTSYPFNSLVDRGMNLTAEIHRSDWYLDGAYVEARQASKNSKLVIDYLNTYIPLRRTEKLHIYQINESMKWWWIAPNGGTRDDHLGNRKAYLNRDFLDSLKGLYDHLVAFKVNIALCINHPSGWSVINVSRGEYGSYNHRLDSYRMTRDPGNKLYEEVYKYMTGNANPEYTYKTAGNKIETLMGMISMAPIGRVMISGVGDSAETTAELIENVRLNMTLCGIGNVCSLKEMSYECLKSSISIMNFDYKGGPTLEDLREPTLIKTFSEVSHYIYMYHDLAYAPNVSTIFIYHYPDIVTETATNVYVRVFINFDEARPLSTAVDHKMTEAHIFLPYSNKGRVQSVYIGPILNMLLKKYNYIYLESGKEIDKPLIYSCDFFPHANIQLVHREVDIDATGNPKHYQQIIEFLMRRYGSDIMPPELDMDAKNENVICLCCSKYPYVFESDHGETGHLDSNDHNERKLHYQTRGDSFRFEPKYVSGAYSQRDLPKPENNWNTGDIPEVKCPIHDCPVHDSKYPEMTDFDPNHMSTWDPYMGEDRNLTVNSFIEWATDYIRTLHAIEWASFYDWYISGNKINFPQFDTNVMDVQRASSLDIDQSTSNDKSASTAQVYSASTKHPGAREDPPNSSPISSADTDADYWKDWKLQQWVSETTQSDYDKMSFVADRTRRTSSQSDYDKKATSICSRNMSKKNITRSKCVVAKVSREAYAADVAKMAKKYGDVELVQIVEEKEDCAKSTGVSFILYKNKSSVDEVLQLKKGAETIRGSKVKFEEKLKNTWENTSDDNDSLVICRYPEMCKCWSHWFATLPCEIAKVPYS